jgi:hypothetical protein
MLKEEGRKAAAGLVVTGGEDHGKTSTLDIDQLLAEL